MHYDSTKFFESMCKLRLANRRGAKFSYHHAGRGVSKHSGIT